MKLTHKEEYLPKAANILAYILPGEKERICFYCPEKKCKLNVNVADKLL